MNDASIKILLIDDDIDDKVLVEDVLAEIQDVDFNLQWASNFNEGKKALQGNNFDLCLVDYHLGKNTGIDLIKFADKKQIEKPFILLTGQKNKENDRAANDAGAMDYLLKENINSETLERSIRYALSKSKLIKRAKGNEIKYRALFQNSKDAIVLTNKNFEILESNPMFYQFFELESELQNETNLKEIIQSSSLLREVKKELSSQNFSEDKEFMFYTKAGEERHGLVFFNKYIQTNGDVIFQGIIRDITKRKKAEKELIYLQRMEAASDTAQALAHEIRNPLMSINLSVGFLRENIKDEEAEKYFEIISRSSQRINDLITDLLNSSKDSGFEFEKASINILTKRAIAVVQDRAQLKNVKIESSIPDIDITCNISIKNFEMAITNILVNAIEALEDSPNGKINITLKECRNEAILSISDNGKGIAADRLDKIFSPFHSDKKSGMGLGLTATRNIVARHKGRIEVKSELNKGTTFYIYLPTL